MEFKQNYLIDIKDYKMIGNIDKGGFGSVYKALNKKTNEILAAKVATGGSQNLKMINREIKIMIHFNHPTITKLVGYSRQDFWYNNAATIFMKLEKNGSLRSVITESLSGFAPDFFNDTGRQIILIGIAYGMMILHKNNVIHRDLKPENILIDENFHPLITDFGLSKFYKSGHSMNQSMNPGTLAYMAPEVLLGEQYNSKADVYSFGILMHEVLTDKSPYHNLSPKQMNIAIFTRLITQNDFQPNFDKSIKKSFQNLLKQCWSRNPDDRPTFEEIYYKLAYNFDDFITNEEEEEDKYFLPNVDKVAVEDYLEEIENSDFDNFSLKTVNERIQEIEKKIETKDENIRLLKKENDKIKEMFNSLQLEFNEMKIQFQKCLSNQNSTSDHVKEQIEALNQVNKNLRDEAASIKNLKESTDHSINCLKYEVKKLKEKPASSKIPDELFEDIQNAQETANKANSKYDIFNHSINCLKYEVKKLKEKPVSSKIPDELYQDIQNAQKTANKANSKYDNLKAENNELNHSINCLKYEVKKLKEKPVH